jgi:aldose sugar dehydrogenase
MIVKHLSSMYLLLHLLYAMIILASVDMVPANASSGESIEITKDPNLEVQLITNDLEFPAGMVFLGPEDILVTEKNTGEVKRVIDGEVLEDPVLDFNVANSHERGLLGIAISNEGRLENSGSYTSAGTRNVFLFVTESSDEDGSDKCKKVNYCEEGNPVGHHLYKYEWKDEKLVNPQLLLDIPSNPGADHLGGDIVVGPDGNIYIVIGDGDSCEYDSCEDEIYQSVIYAQTSNFNEGDLPQGRGGIIRIAQDGSVVTNEGGSRDEGQRQGTEAGILGDAHPLNMYYAYGIRNSFGMDFDPVTGKLWDTENGPGFGDEINLVEPGFNSGWAKAQGIWPISDYELLDPTPRTNGYVGEADIISANPEGLVDFNEHGKYSNPEFTWNEPVGPTSIKFFDSDKLGKQYENDVFVGDIKFGNLYSFDLAEDRKELSLTDVLADKIANDEEELEEVIYAKGFSGITDIEVGPDGYLYILSASGSLHRIINSS